MVPVLDDVTDGIARASSTEAADGFASHYLKADGMTPGLTTVAAAGCDHNGRCL